MSYRLPGSLISPHPTQGRALPTRLPGAPGPTLSHPVRRRNRGTRAAHNLLPSATMRGGAQEARRTPPGRGPEGVLWLLRASARGCCQLVVTATAAAMAISPEPADDASSL